MATTLADHLRSLPDNALGAFLRRRPDLLVPVPADLSVLATRAQSRVSVARALDGLDEFTLLILDAARLTRSATDGTASVDAVLTLAAGAAGPAREALDRLRELCLLYGPDHALRLPAVIDEACPPYPAGLGRPADQLDPAAAALCADPAKLRRTLLSAPPAARAVLDRLAAGPPVGTVSTGPDTVPNPAAGPATDTGTVPNTGPTGAGPTGAGTTGAGPDAAGENDNPVRWLVEHHLLVRISPVGGGHGAVELPRELGLLLRRETGPLGPLRHTPPPVDAPIRKPRTVDSAGAGQAMEMVRQVETLLEALATEPAAILRTGGIGARDVRRLARAAAVDEQFTPLLLEVAYAGGLAGEAEAPGRDRIGRAAPISYLLPTAGYDGWRTASLAHRWAHLAETWLHMTRQPGLIGQRDERDRPLNVLAPEVERAGAATIRYAALGALLELPPGTAPPPDALLALLSWRHPRRAKGREAATAQALEEAARLGLTGLGALTSYAGLLLSPTPEQPADEDPFGLRDADATTGAPAATRALDALLPSPVDHILVQADLTVVVPGPPDPGLAAELESVADHESAGGASVYRVTPESVRRGLDAGYAAEDLHGLFKHRSRTPVPQSLTYLIDDIARKHGGLRVGSAGAYLRSDDEALLAEVLADRRLAPLALRRLAPTVLATPYQSGRLLAALRDAGFAPVAEDAGGAALVNRPRARRAGARGLAPTPITDPLAPAGLTEPRVLGIVEQIRKGDAVALAARRAPVTVRSAGGNGTDRANATQAHTQALAVLQQAIRDKAQVWVGYVDAHGSTATRMVRPVSIGGGYLRAEDDRTDMLHTFALHRITAAVLDD